MSNKQGLDMSDLMPFKEDTGSNDGENYTSLRKPDIKIRKIKSPLLNKNKSNSNISAIMEFSSANRISNYGANVNVN